MLGRASSRLGVADAFSLLGDSGRARVRLSPAAWTLTSVAASVQVVRRLLPSAR
jgi:hypothetical protein